MGRKKEKEKERKQESQKERFSDLKESRAPAANPDDTSAGPAEGRAWVRPVSRVFAACLPQSVCCRQVATVDLLVESTVYFFFIVYMNR